MLHLFVYVEHREQKGEMRETDRQRKRLRRRKRGDL